MKELILSVGHIVNLLIPIAASLALLYFFYGLGKFILKADEEGAREEGKQVMIWGIVSLFVLVSIWGIVKFIGHDLGIPQIRTPGGGAQYNDSNQTPFPGQTVL